jgi:hypothetical protein
MGDHDLAAIGDAWVTDVLEPEATRVERRGRANA